MKFFLIWWFKTKVVNVYLCTHVYDRWDEVRWMRSCGTRGPPFTASWVMWKRKNSANWSSQRSSQAAEVSTLHYRSTKGTKVMIIRNHRGRFSWQKKRTAEKIAANKNFNLDDSRTLTALSWLLQITSDWLILLLVFQCTCRFRILSNLGFLKF